MHSAGWRAACSEWLVNQHRDSYASYRGHYNILMHIAVAENESIGRVKFNMLEVRLASPRASPGEGGPNRRRNVWSALI